MFHNSLSIVKLLLCVDAVAVSISPTLNLIMANCVSLRCCCPFSSEVCRLTETVSMIFCWISLFGAFLLLSEAKSAFFTFADFSVRLTSSAL